MIRLSKVDGNLVIESDQSTLNGTQIYINDNLKFTITDNGLESNVLGDDYCGQKYKRLFMINLNKINADFGDFFEAGVSEDSVRWFLIDNDGSNPEQVGTGYYFASEEEIENSGAYLKLILDKNSNFYFNGMIIRPVEEVE